jgi:hypothetical protein
MLMKKQKAPKTMRTKLGERMRSAVDGRSAVSLMGHLPACVLMAGV